MILSSFWYDNYYDIVIIEKYEKLIPKYRKIKIFLEDIDREYIEKLFGEISEDYGIINYFSYLISKNKDRYLIYQKNEEKLDRITILLNSFQEV